MKHGINRRIVQPHTMAKFNGENSICQPAIAGWHILSGSHY